MIDLMLIDDDIVSRDQLREMIEWDRLGLHLVCEAGDGGTARELFQMHQPKIIVTDITIPVVSGLELTREFLQQDPDLRAIVITGQGDLYSKRSMVGLDAIELLSKPVDPDELNAALKRCTDHFTQLRRQLHTKRALGELLAENQDLLRERCIARLFSQAPEGGEVQIRKQFELLSLSFPERYFAAVMIRLGASSSGIGAAFPAAFKKLCEAAFHASGFRTFTFYDREDHLNCLVNWSFDQGEERMDAMLSKLQKETQFYFQAGFSACTGGPVEQLSLLYRSAEQAQLASRFQDAGHDDIVNYRSIGKRTSAEPVCDEQILARLIEHARASRRIDFLTLLERVFAGTTMDQARDLALELLSRLANLCFQSNVYPWSTVNYPYTIAGIYGAATAEELLSILTQVSEDLMDALYYQRTKSKNPLIHLAKEYIREHLGDPELSLDTVSSHIGLSKVYFCQLFHREEGINFNNYLNTERINQAKRLLSNTSKKVFEISDETGYSNPKYFNYVFKQAVGMTPLEYRKKSNEN